MKSRFAVLILIVLFGIMSAASWERWANPIIDGGREMNTPLRLLQGEQIYSEVYYLYGPAAPFFNAFLYKIFGVHLRTLYAAGLAGGLLLVLLIFYLGRKFMSVFEAMLAAVAVLLLCVFKQRGNMVFPYSYAALYGTLLGTLALPRNWPTFDPKAAQPVLRGNPVRIDVSAASWNSGLPRPLRLPRS